MFSRVIRKGFNERDRFKKEILVERKREYMFNSKSEKEQERESKREREREMVK